MKLFSKKLTATDCLKRLTIPKKVLISLPEFHGGHAAELQVRFETNEYYWPLFCTIRTKGRYMKPVISKGWGKFVRANRLSVGDEVTFHKEEDEDEESDSLHYYRVEIKRATRLPSTALSQSPPPPLEDHVDVAETTSTVVNCSDQASTGTSGHLGDQFGSVEGGTREGTCMRTSKELKLFGVDVAVTLAGAWPVKPLIIKSYHN